MMAASTLIMGRIEEKVGQHGASFPTTSGDKKCIVFDGGQDVDSKPQHLFEYAVLGTIFAKEMYAFKIQQLVY